MKRSWWRWLGAAWAVGGIAFLAVYATTPASSTSSTSSTGEEETGKGWLSSWWSSSKLKALQDRIDGWGIFGQADASIPDPGPAALRSAFVWPTLIVVAPWVFLWPGSWVRVQRDFTSVGLKFWEFLK